MREGPRAARPEELAAIVAMVNGVFYPNGDIDMGKYLPTLFCRENIPNLRVVLENGTPVSVVGFTVRDLALGGAVVRAACIGAVSTEANHRGQGLASVLVQDAVAAARAQGAALLLVSGGRSLYRRMGCVDAGLYRQAVVTRHTALPAPHGRVSEWTAADVPDMVGLHQREPVRFIRRPDEMRMLLESGALFVRPARTWVVRTEEGLLAYLCVGEPEDKTEKGTLIVREMAGSRAEVLAALPRVMEAGRVDRVEIETTESDAELCSLARIFSLPFAPAGFQGTVKIIDREGFFTSLGSYAAEGLLSAVSDEELAALAFGSREKKAPTPGGALGEIFAKLFPLPLPCYGLSYI